MKRLMKTPFILHDEFECVLVPSTDNIDFFPKAIKYQGHIVCADGCNWIWLMTDIVNLGEDAIYTFLNNMIKKLNIALK